MQNKTYILLVNYVQNHQDKFYRVAYSYVKNHDDALDIVQESIYKALKAHKSIISVDFLSTWYYRILINTSLSYIRKKKPYTVVPIETLDTAIETPLEKEDLFDLYDALDILQPDDKTIVILRYFEDMKFKDIADITNQNVNTIKTRHTKILKQLKLQLDGEVNTSE